MAGSRRLPEGQAPRLLIKFFAALPDDAVILLRRGLYTEPNRFESDVENLCHLVRLVVEWCVPDPSDETPGRAATYVRDYSMVESADLVLLFLMSDDDGSSGTAHLQDAALQADRPCYVYGIQDVTVTRVGEYDPDHLYSELVPQP